MPDSTPRPAASVNHTIFIDANIYLKFYGPSEAKELFNSLLAQKQHVFVTRQIVNEVARKKLIVARDYFEKQVKEGIPELIIPSIFDDETEKKLREQVTAIGVFRNTVKAASLKALQNVADSKDGISKSLEVLFASAIANTSDELELASQRKKLGNPPGKSKNSLGDELNWEQLLSHLKVSGITKLWLITNDEDYFVKYGKTLLVNPMLRRELGDIEVSVFNNITDGISEFAKATGEGQKELPPKARLEEIKDRIKSVSDYSVIYWGPTGAHSSMPPRRSQYFIPPEQDKLGWIPFVESDSDLNGRIVQWSDEDGSDDPKE